MPSGIWALTLVPGRKYTQVVDASFRLTQACLLDDTVEGRTCLKAKIDEQEFVLCSLNVKTIDSQVLDICFFEGDSVTFSASGVNTISLTGHYIPGQPSLIEETFNMLEDRDPLDQEYLDGFGMHHFGIGPTDAEDKNLREDEVSPLETIENDHLLHGLINSMINSGDDMLMSRGYKALAQIAAKTKTTNHAKPNGKGSSKSN
ncbi:peptidylprolyl isomerase fpr3 [Umbelopsis nana]